MRTERPRSLNRRTLQNAKARTFPRLLRRVAVGGWRELCDGGNIRAFGGTRDCARMLAEQRDEIAIPADLLHRPASLVAQQPLARLGPVDRRITRLAVL